MRQVNISVGMNGLLFMDCWGLVQGPVRLFWVLVGIKQTFEHNCVAVEHFASLTKVLHSDIDRLVFGCVSPQFQNGKRSYYEYKYIKLSGCARTG